MDYGTGYLAGRVSAVNQAQHIINDQARTLTQWQQYAAELEQQINDLNAKVLASRDTIDECVEQIENLNPRSAWANRESVREYTKSLYQQHIKK